MSKALFIFLLWLVPTSLLAAGGNSSLHIFYCETAGCAAIVLKVFCDDHCVFEKKEVEVCRGLPSLHFVCRHDDRAFVSTLKATTCEFESKNSYIKTIQCTDVDPVCLTLPLTTSTTLSPATSDVEKKPEWTIDKTIYIILAVICVIALLGVALTWHYRRRRQIQGPDQPAPDPTRNPG